MTSRTETYRQIRHESITLGLPAALLTARSAFASGQLDQFDLPEIFLCLHSGSWRSLAATLDLAAGDPAERASTA